MSINIGYLGNNYGTDNIDSMDNRLVINTYNTSNSININTNPNSTTNAVINYKNLFKTGVIDNNYVIQNSNNDNAIILTNSNININKNLILNNNITCKSLLNTSNDTFNITSNINIYLYNNNNFNCYDKDTSNINFTFNNSRFTVNKESYFNQNIYANDIRPLNPNAFINIYKANLIDNVLLSTNVITTLSINNTKSQPYKNSAFLINRYYNDYNIIEFNTCNFNINTTSNTYYNEPIFKHFALNNNGMVSIGSKLPDASLSISANYNDIPYVFKYTGTQLSDTFNISKDANIGIGTTNPLGILHINRNDDKYDTLTCNLQYNSVRNLPLIKLNLDYDSAKNNITSSNTDIIINSNNILATNIYNYSLIPKNINQAIFDNTSQLINNIYILNDELLSVFNNNNITYKKYILNNYLINNTYSGLDTNPNTGVVFSYKNNIYYPDNIFVSDYTPDYNYIRTTSIQNTGINNFLYRSINTYSHGIIVMSKDTYNTGEYVSTLSSLKYNANNFTKITSNYFISTLTSSRENINGSNFYYYQDVNFSLNMYVEKKNLKTSYTTSNILIPSPPPDFLYLTSNNEFKAAISHNGILSLGTKYTLDDNNYILYIPDKIAYINNAEINSITTKNSSIVFNNCNISAINNIKAVSANITNGAINNINSSNIIIYNQLSIKNITMNSSNIHLTNKLSISSDPLDTSSILTDLSSLMKITVNSNIVKEANDFKNSVGLVITNNNISTTLSSNINPSIAIYGNGGSYPLIKLSKNKITEPSTSYIVENALNNYFIRLATKQYNVGTTSFLDHFEVCCDNIRDSTNRIEYYNNINSIRSQTNILPSFIKHIKNYNLLCFGELNNVCIKCDNSFSDIYNSTSQTSPNVGTFTNSTNKISLGIPFKDPLVMSDNLQNTIEDWSQIFNNKICKEPSANDLPVYNKYSNNMLNIFGNTGIWSISGNNILKAKMNVDVSYNDIGCDIIIGTDNSYFSSNTNLNVYGGITSATCVKTYASSNLMYNITSNDIINPVEKIKNITGYSYNRVDTNVREIGLKAEEVHTQFPTLVNTHNDKLTIQYANIAAIFVEAIKELSSNIAVINTRLTAIETRLT